MRISLKIQFRHQMFETLIRKWAALVWINMSYKLISPGDLYPIKRQYAPFPAWYQSVTHCRKTPAKTLRVDVLVLVHIITLLY